MSGIPRKKIAVYLADDHAVVRDGLRLVLEAEPDMTVVGDAADGRRAVGDVQRLRPDVIVMDISMPLLNGIEATLKIREQSPQTQVVILSMHATSEHVYQALRAGAKGYLLKESAGREVVAAVREVVAGRRHIASKLMEGLVDDYVRSRSAAPPQSPLDRLSSREREVLQLVVEGKSSAEIGRVVHLSPKTVDTYRSRLMKKLEIKNVPGLVRFAVSHGLTPSE